MKGKDGEYTAQTYSEAKSVKTAEYPSFVTPKFGAKKDDVLKSMGGKSRFMKDPEGETDGYISTVLYRGKQASCVLIFNEKEQIKGYCLLYKADSKEEYNKIRDAYDKKYGDPIKGNVNTEGESRMWLDINGKKKATGGLMIVYESKTKKITEAFAYVYDNTDDVFEGIAA